MAGQPEPEVPTRTSWRARSIVRAKKGRNPLYDFLCEVAPGDVVFSFVDTHIKAIGIVASHGYESPKPLEFGQAGAYWDHIGRRVDVRIAALCGLLKPAVHMAQLAPLLSTRDAAFNPLEVICGATT